MQRIPLQLVRFRTLNFGRIYFALRTTLGWRKELP